MLLSCPRHARPISDSECCQTVVDTVGPADLAVCMRCEHGQTLAASCPLQPRHIPFLPGAVEAMPEDRTEAVLPVLLRHVLERFPKEMAHGVAFLVRVAEAQHGYEGNAKTLLDAAREAGLHTFTKARRVCVVMDDAARFLAASA